MKKENVSKIIKSLEVFYLAILKIEPFSLTRYSSSNLGNLYISSTASVEFGFLHM